MSFFDLHVELPGSFIHDTSREDRFIGLLVGVVLLLLLLILLLGDFWRDYGVAHSGLLLFPRLRSISNVFVPRFHCLISISIILRRLICRKTVITPILQNDGSRGSVCVLAAI